MFLFKKSKIAIVVLVTVVITLVFLILSEIIFLFPLFIYAQQNTNLFITHGVASGDVTDHSAVIWSRANKEAQMHVEYDTNSNFSSSSKSLTITTANVNETTDFTGHVKLDNLNPNTQYFYRVWFSSHNISNNTYNQYKYINGTFKTAPSSSSVKPSISFVSSEYFSCVGGK